MFGSTLPKLFCAARLVVVVTMNCDCDRHGVLIALFPQCTPNAFGSTMSARIVPLKLALIWPPSWPLVTENGRPVYANSLPPIVQPPMVRFNRLFRSFGMFQI